MSGHLARALLRQAESLGYRLGELLRVSADYVLLLSATPYKGDRQYFTLFLQPLDRDAYADVRSICEAMISFPEDQTDGTLSAKSVFTNRIRRTAGFAIDGPGRLWTILASVQWS